MARVQLALNVTDLDTAVDFYSKLFDTAPAKRRPGYANFAVADTLRIVLGIFALAIGLFLFGLRFYRLVLTLLFRFLSGCYLLRQFFLSKSRYCRIWRR